MKEAALDERVAGLLAACNVEAVDSSAPQRDGRGAQQRELAVAHDDSARVAREHDSVAIDSREEAVRHLEVLSALHEQSAQPLKRPIAT